MDDLWPHSGLEVELPAPESVREQTAKSTFVYKNCKFYVAKFLYRIDAVDDLGPHSNPDNFPPAPESVRKQISKSVCLQKMGKFSAAHFLYQILLWFVLYMFCGHIWLVYTGVSDSA